MQGDFYTTGKYGEAGLQGFNMEKAIAENPDYVVFNGAVGSLTGEKALKASVGETVRLFVGNGGPNLVSSFHVIGEIFDRVYQEGGSRYNENVQTTLVPAGGSTICEFKLDTKGDFILVDHSIFRAFNKGALGILNADGEGDLLVFSGQKKDEVYLPEGGAIQTIPSNTKAAPPAANKEERILAGLNVYGRNCAACHMPTGTGVPGAFPPLVKSDYLNADVDRSIGAVLHGLQGEVTVNGNKFNSIMPTLGLNDEDVANVLTYVYSVWDNSGVEVKPEQVAKVRAAKK